MTMRTTVTLADDVAAEVLRLRRERGIGVSEAINELAHRAMATPAGQHAQFRQETFAMQARIDVGNIGDVLELLDVP